MEPKPKWKIPAQQPFRLGVEDRELGQAGCPRLPRIIEHSDETQQPFRNHAEWEKRLRDYAKTAFPTTRGKR